MRAAPLLIVLMLTAGCATAVSRARSIPPSCRTRPRASTWCCEYVVLVYAADYEAGPHREQLVIQRERDGEWRALGYWVRP